MDGTDFTTYEAIERPKEHYAGLVAPMVFLATHLAGAAWTTPRVPRRGTSAFEARRKTERESAAGG